MTKDTTPEALADAYSRSAKGRRLRIPEIAHGQCALEAEHFTSTLKGHGHASLHLRVTGHNYSQREHWAVLIPGPTFEDDMDGTVIDLTARQFRRSAPFPWVGTMDDWLDDAAEWLADSIDYEVVDPMVLWGEPGSTLYVDYLDRPDVEGGEVQYPWQKAG